MMFYVAVLMFGLISLSLLAQELFPPITYPQLSIVTPYENAAPEEIENLITRPIEEAVGGISGLRKVSSTSKEGLSLVVVEFGWNQSMDFASLAIREKVDLIKQRLPRDSQEPVVIKFNPFDLPIITISISSNERSPVQLREVARKWFKEEIEKINGVASASISGGLEEQILVDIDQAKMRTAGVSINEVSDSISAANLNYPGGTIKESFYEYLVRTLGEFKRVSEIGQIPVKRANIDRTANPRLDEDPNKIPSNRLILLRDIASINRTVKERSSYSRHNSRENVTISVQKQAQSNTLQTVALIRKKLGELEEQLPRDIQIDVIYDQSKFIKEAITGVSDAAIQGGFLAFFVLLIFLRDARNSALVVTITPITILATFTLMYFMGISLNVISLGGVALGVGMLVDNAIVVIENVYRRYSLDKQMGITVAARVGAEEVIAPMIASTLTTVAVFLPLVFVTGIAGQIFKELAWVVVVTQIVSGLIAFTLLPVLIVKSGAKPTGDFAAPGAGPEEPSGKPSVLGRVNRLFTKALDACAKPIAWIERAYAATLPVFIRRRGPFLTGIFLLFVVSIFGFALMDKVMMPKVDQGQFMVKVDLPVGTRLGHTNRVCGKIEAYLERIPEVQSLSAVVGSSRGDDSKDVLERLGSHQAQVIVTLKEKRERSTTDITQQVRQHFELSAGREEIRPARLSYVLYDNAFSLGGGNESPIVIDIKGPRLDKLKEIAEDVQDKISRLPGIYGVTNSIAEPFPETKIIINKERSSYYRLSVTNIASAANIAIKGYTPSRFKEEGREIDIRVQLQERDRDDIQKLGQLLIHSPLDLDVPLADFVKFEVGKGPSEIKRLSQERTVQVYAKLYNRGLKEATDDVLAILKTIRPPEKYSVQIAGENEEIQESFASLQFAFTLSIILVYMIMASQFESLTQPLLIMLCVPLSLIGVSLGLFVTGTPISVVVILGIILLAGIAVNNGIILIDYTNQRRLEGAGILDAAVVAGKTRLRPIMMTASTTVIGLLPLAMGIGEGSKLQSPMAIAVMGGMSVSTFLTLYVVPAIYVGTEEISEWLRNRSRRKA